MVLIHTVQDRSESPTLSEIHDLSLQHSVKFMLA